MEIQTPDDFHYTHLNLALDAFGGDKAPSITIAGAIRAISEHSLETNEKYEVTLVGSYKDLQPYLPKILPDGLKFLDVASHESPTEKGNNLAGTDPNSAIRTAMRLHAEGVFDAVVSAGSTGAQVLASLFELEKCSGITRPAIGTLLPTATGKCLLIDVGASLVASPHHLVQFAAMGGVYVSELLQIGNPRIGLINVAGEASGGDRTAVEAHKLLSESGFNFVGFVEGRDIPDGVSDVAVTNGFVGNILLKFAEGIPSLLNKILPSATSESIRMALHDSFDYHAFGGEPLLGVKGVSVICHGASSERAIASALNQAAKISVLKLPDKIEDFLSKKFTTYYSQVKYLRSFRRDMRSRE